MPTIDEVVSGLCQAQTEKLKAVDNEVREKSSIHRLYIHMHAVVEGRSPRPVVIVAMIRPFTPSTIHRPTDLHPPPPKKLSHKQNHKPEFPNNNQ